MSTNGLPANWTVAPLGELGAWIGGGTPSKSEAKFWQDGTIPWVSPKDMKVFEIRGSEDQITTDAVENSAARLLPSGAVLVVTRSGILERTLPVAVTMLPVAVNQDLKALVPAAGVEPKYVAYGLQRFDHEIRQSCAKDGTTVASIDFPALKRFTLPLAPLPEQRRIVEAIETQLTRLDAAVAALKRAQANLKRYRASVLKAAVEGRLVETNSACGSPSFRMSSLGELKIWSIYGPRYSSDDYQDSGVSVLRTSDISDGGKVDLSTTPKLQLGEEEFQKYKVLPGDLLITRTGSIGTLAIYDDEVPSIAGAYLIHYRVDSEVVRPRYLLHFLKGPDAQSILRRSGAGVGRPNLNAPTIESIPIPLPSVSIQDMLIDEVDRRISIIEAQEQGIQSKLIRAEGLRQSILREAFEGKLVP